MDNGFVDLPNDGGEFLIGMDQTRSADQYKYARSLYIVYSSNTTMVVYSDHNQVLLIFLLMIDAPPPHIIKT